MPGILGLHGATHIPTATIAGREKSGQNISNSKNKSAGAVKYAAADIGRRKAQRIVVHAKGDDFDSTHSEIAFPRIHKMKTASETSKFILRN